MLPFKGTHREQDGGQEMTKNPHGSSVDEHENEALYFAPHTANGSVVHGMRDLLPSQKSMLDGTPFWMKVPVMLARSHQRFLHTHPNAVAF